MTPEDVRLSIKIGLLTGLVVGSFFFVLGLLWQKLPRLLRPVVWWFFGRGVFTDDFQVVYGTLHDNRIPGAKPTDLRFRKFLPDGRQYDLVGPWQGIVGNAEIRATSYLISSLSGYRAKPIDTVEDLRAFEKLNSSCIALGSQASNAVSDFILKQQENHFLEFGQDQNGETYIRSKCDGQVFKGFSYRDGKDLGLIPKVKNARFPGHYFFVCGGLGEWGTSGAAWYLARKWRNLSFSREGFGVILEVNPGSDTTARVIFTSKSGSSRLKKG